MAVADVLISIGVFVAIYAILAYGMNIKFGHTGLLDFGHVGFYLIGAYTATLFVLPPDDPADFTAYVIGLGEVPIVGNWIVGLIVATVLAGIIGGIVALPTIRLREDYLAITVLGISVIFQRVIQSEEWLANGPDALRGYSPPLKSLFPLALETFLGPVVFGLIVLVIWAGATGLLAREKDRQSRLPLSGIFLVATFGLSRVGGDEGFFADNLNVAVGAAIIAAVGSAVLLFVAETILLIGTIVSIYTWFVAAVAVAHHYEEMGVRESVTGIVLGTGLLVALLPLPMLDDLATKIVLTLVALVVLVGAYAWAVRNREWVNEAKLPVVGMGALWFFGIWYFLLPIIGPIQQNGITAGLNVLFQNIVWVLKFGGDVGIDYTVAVIGDLTLNIDYTRFILAGFLLFTAGLYYVLEVTVQSPFGRVLRAVRNDEAVVKSLGKDPFVYKVQSMVIGSALGGFAGALWAMWAQGLVFTMFAPRVTFVVLLILFIGGAGNNKGMIAGAAVYWAFQEGTTQLAGFFPPEVRVNVLAFRMVVIGILFLVILYYMPEGLLGRSEYTSEVDSS